uniref:Uncharacterized protein n=1 Tax=Phlebotomus papatasi TaxID=29031 RepID=A0A1B0D878_PHLPP
EQPTERQVRIQLKDHIDRCKKRKQESREDYRYSGSDNDDEEPQTAGEPSSIIQAPGGDTLRRNFQQIQEGRTMAQSVEAQQPQPNRNQKPQREHRGAEKQPIEEPGPPSRPALPQRLIVVPDGSQHANRPLPPTPRSSGSSQAQQQTPQQAQRNSQNMFKPMGNEIHRPGLSVLSEDSAAPVPSHGSGGPPNRPLPPTPDDDDQNQGDRTLIMKRKQKGTDGQENEERVLLREWDIERFFPTSRTLEQRSKNGGNPSGRDRISLQPQEMKKCLENVSNDSKGTNDANKMKLEDRVKSEIFANNSRAKQEALAKMTKNVATHKRQDSDSKLSLNFVRGFRRENTDFFPLAKRHSAILGERIASGNTNNSGGDQSIVQRSSGIFQRRPKVGAEPILTDYRESSPAKSQTKDAKQNTTSTKTSSPSRHLDFLRPR